MTATPPTGGWACPLPLRDHPLVTAGHGGGGQMTADLIEHLFLPAFGAAAAPDGLDAAVLDLGDEPPGSRLAFSTDGHVVDPIEFPGGTIGDLAVNGTVNDLAMVGARPTALAAAFVLDEGLPLATLDRVARAMGRAARDAGVRIVAGDTKVVDRAPGDGGTPGLTITTTGVGVIPPGVEIAPAHMAPGDAVVLSGPIGSHGMTIMSVRDGLGFAGRLRSDTAALHEPVAALLAAGIEIRAMRDLTRGGLATGLCELATRGRRGIEFDETAVTVPDDVRAATGVYGLDPFVVANEGVCVVVVPAAQADAAVAELGRHAVTSRARAIGSVTDDHPGMVVARTALGARRVVDPPLGEHLPRIC